MTTTELPFSKSAPPVRKAKPPPTAPVGKKSIKFSPVGESGGHRILLYGPGGIGKTSRATEAPGPVAFIDLDNSLPKLKTQLDLSHLKIVDAPTWADLRGVLQSDGWDDIATIVIDTVTKAEEMAIIHTLANVKTDGKSIAEFVESYGFGKGYQYVYETFLPLLADLDRHQREGRNVILIAHDCTANVPNPSGENWLRYEPRLQSPTSGKSSIRLRIKEWSDHVLFMAYDVAVNKQGKGIGSGTRTIYTSELPSFMAKSRTTQEAIPVDAGTDVWSKIIV
jgi:hypothetical protein